MIEKKALGRGLSALIPTRETEIGIEESVLQVPIKQIQPNKYQPRVEFNKEKLNDLINSIKEKGVIQPVLVRKTQAGYELIAGERRLKAVAALGIENIPAIVKNVADVDMLELSLIENIQREELNPIEEANSFQRFITEFNFTQEKIAQVLGKDRSTIANTIRLLGLPRKIQDYISKNSITQGHARAILSLPSDDEKMRVSNLVIKKSLSVRETEKLVSRRLNMIRPRKIELKRDPHISQIEDFLQQKLGTRVKILHGKKRGIVQIEYYSNEDLERIVGIFSSKL